VHSRDARGYIVDEFPDCAQISNVKLTVSGFSMSALSMSHCGLAGTCGSQFFINLSDNDFHNFWDTSCPSKRPVFGKVRKGSADLVTTYGF
jgi:cyclophilin family peptidyl-prolyl cis-trans isomerase